MESLTIEGSTYQISSMDFLRAQAGDCFQDQVLGSVDVTGNGHYAEDSIEDKTVLTTIFDAIRLNRYTERRSIAVEHCNVQTAYGRSRYL